MFDNSLAQQYRASCQKRAFVFPIPLGLPLPTPVVNTPSVMVNLIGTAVNQQWLSLPLVHLHWYEKEVREGRKVGHLNLNDPDASALRQALQALAPMLPAEYQSGLVWAQSKL